jgi:TonB family protein
MGDSASNDRRRYARPGEFEIPNSVLESNSFKQRLGGALNSDRKSPAPVSSEVRVGGVSDPVRRNPSPLASEERMSLDLNQQSRNAVPVSRELRPRGESNLARNPAPAGSEARLSVVREPSRSIVPVSRELPRMSVHLNQPPRSAAPPSRQLPPGGGSNLGRSSSVPLWSEARSSVDLNQPPRSAVPPSRQLPPSGGSNLGRSSAPLGSEARSRVDLNQTPRSAVPPSRQLPPGGGSNLRRSPARLGSEARSSVELNQYRRSPAPLACRDAIIRRRTSARFELLPEPQSLWNQIGLSAAAQLLFLGLLLLSPMMFPQQMATALKYDVTELMQPVTHIEIPPTTPPPPPKVKPKVQPKPIVPKPKPVEVQPPQLNPKQPHVFLVLKPELKKVRTVEAKPVELKPVFAQPEIVLSTNQPKRPKEEIKAPILQPMRKEDIQAPSLGLGALPATVVAAASKVQTGGFGDPHGIHGPANPSKAANINQAGSANLPGGPGYGNGTGGAQGARGTLASTDGPKSNGAGAGGAGTGGTTTGVAILSKPNPAYSTEARTMKLEGDVVLDVVFLASGQVQVISVVSGLGHGLDEAAIRAARMIRFRPAQRNGQPVDFHAHVRIEFRLVE